MELGPIVRALRRNKTRFGLIALEIALTLAIVTNCVTMILEARTKMVRASGFDDSNIVTVRSVPFDAAFKEDGYLDNSLRADLEALRAVPGVLAVSNSRFLPWQGGGSSTEMRPVGPKGEMLRTQIYNADEATFDTLGVKVTEGTGFTAEHTDADTLRLRALFLAQRELGQDGLPKDKFNQDVVISRAFAKLAFGDAPALGKLLEDSDGDMYRVVGLIDDFYNPYGWPIHEYVVFFASRNRSYEGGAPYLVRTEPGQAAAVTKALEDKLIATNGGRNIRVRTLDEIKAQFFGGQRITVTLMTGTVVLLILVTSLGIVGLTSFSVTERTRQIGTRRALGARRVDILRHFLLENWVVTSCGLVLGVGLAYALNMGLMSGAAATKLGWPMVASGVLLLWMAGILATLAPALRASRISPAIATRNV
jgi:putative ABC transport system permease protein